MKLENILFTIVLLKLELTFVDGYLEFLNHERPTSTNKSLIIHELVNRKNFLYLKADFVRPLNQVLVSIGSFKNLEIFQHQAISSSAWTFTRKKTLNSGNCSRPKTTTGADWSPKKQNQIHCSGPFSSRCPKKFQPFQSVHFRAIWNLMSRSRGKWSWFFQMAFTSWLLMAIDRMIPMW